MADATGEIKKTESWLKRHKLAVAIIATLGAVFIVWVYFEDAISSWWNSVMNGLENAKNTLNPAAATLGKTPVSQLTPSQVNGQVVDLPDGKTVTVSDFAEIQAQAEALNEQSMPLGEWIQKHPFLNGIAYTTPA